MKRLLLLVLAVIAAASLWSAAYGADNGKEPGRVISGTGAVVVKVVPTSEVEKFIDFSTPPDGINDYRVVTQLRVAKYTGVLEGMASGPFTSTFDLTTNIARYSALYTFWGTVGSSEPGTMSVILSGFSDASVSTWRVFTTRIVVVEGSGTGGLEGISGFGEVPGEGPTGGPYAGTPWWEFRFSNASGKAFLASP